MRAGSALLLVALFCRCAEPRTPGFPDGFLYGAATSGFQVEMGCPTLPADECEDAGSDWHQLITSKALLDAMPFVTRDGPGAGPGHYEKFREDLALAQDLGLDAFRMGIEWSRLFPRATDGIDTHDALRAHANPKALAYYHAVFAELRARGLAPLVTLNHYTLPLWIHDGAACHRDIVGCQPRGWLDGPRIVRELSKYAAFCAREFGGQVDLWATLNEPLAVVLPGYLFPSQERANPPAVRFRYAEAKQAMRHMVEAHARMYDAVKANDALDADGDGEAAAVGLVYALVPTAPKNPDSPLDRRAAESLFRLYNAVFLDAAVRGELDAELDGQVVQREDLAGRMDWLGLNYYTRVIVEGTETPTFAGLSPWTTFNPLTIDVSDVYPDGLFEMLGWLSRYALPVIVTENGAPNAADDEAGTQYLEAHWRSLERAVRSGAYVRGYFYWSLIDNFEWNHGMTSERRYGLFAVDAADPGKARVPRRTAEVLRELVGNARARH